jgi:hypothetical protein
VSNLYRNLLLVLLGLGLLFYGYFSYNYLINCFDGNFSFITHRNAVANQYVSKTIYWYDPRISATIIYSIVNASLVSLFLAIYGKKRNIFYVMFVLFIIAYAILVIICGGFYVIEVTGVAQALWIEGKNALSSPFILAPLLAANIIHKRLETLKS